MNPLEDDESLSRRGFLVGTVGTAAAAGASATVAAQENETGNESSDGGGENGGGNETGENGGGQGDDGAGGAVEEVSVVDNEFQPDSLTIKPGTTVRWVWEGDGHNVEPTDIPDESDWEGHLDTENAGFEYEYTFEVEGEYSYVCTPHVGLGMKGDIVVDPNANAGGGGPAELVPDAAWTLVIATTAGMVSVLSLAYGFMRYGGTAPEK